jgi:HlyD family secretion protein
MIARASRIAGWIARQPRRFKAASAGVIVACGAVAVLPIREARVPRAIVVEGPFVETLVESGTLSASRLLLYGAPAGSGALKIGELAVEGSTVRAGDILIRFDASALQASLAREEAELTRAAAALATANEGLRLERLEADGQLEAARQEIASASRDLESEKDGRGKVALAEADAALVDADRAATQARRSVADLTPMLADGFITRAELDRALDAQRRADEQLRLARLRAESLSKYERPAAVERAVAGVSRAQQGYKRLTETMAARRALAESAVAAAAARVLELRSRVETIRTQIDRTEVRAERAGLVVYREIYFGQDRRKPQVGDEAWPNQPLIALPDSGDLTVDTRVRETDLHRVSGSRRVRVRVDAYPDIDLPAEIALVGALAQEDERRAGTRFFPVSVRLLRSDARLRTGMTARIEIEVAAIDRALLVPLAAVFDLDTRPYCLLDGPLGASKAPIEVAGVNESVVAVRRGLAAGSRVRLAIPGAREGS